ncbi:hypothetical protein K450DRAFT_239750 [Umbelopsis ramanniana AG]|uniref:RING-type domain-containing protein n=1 Tax=Umbelopsis ramanniana AG TaxID=1314678 RepID=A0AAD5EAJ7_UMBRA|nr:uncharacterized protein K450DRAFT_239750 [Umbelopsis ramanniana AG]KAI8579924.1 hypothetical protein K450DRAFT_239750 [Umbelopsis ramanniana AG]
MAGHATSSVLDIVPESEAATVGSSGPSSQSSAPEVNSQTAVQYLNAYNSPADSRATQNGGILESLTPANAAAITARSVNPTSRTVRWNWVNYLRSRWQHISSSSKVLLIITTAISIIQIAASVVAVAISGDGTCERPLKIFLIVYAIRVLLSFPFSMYQYLHPRRRRRTRRRRSNTANAPAETQAPTTVHPISPATEIDNSSSILPPTAPPTTTPPTTGEHQSRTTRRHIIGGRVDRAKSLLDLFATFWFVIGNYFLFGSTSCANTASVLFYVTLTWVVLGYVMITIPILFCAAAIFCLPCVLAVGMRIMQVGEPSEVGGATAEEIQKIPVLRFTDNAADTNSIAESHVSVRSSANRGLEAAPRVGFFRRMLRRKAGQAKPNDIEKPESKRDHKTISFDCSEDAVCAICLSNYEQDELVCRLWCQHHFHKDCLHEWLALNSMCPMCKRDCRGKEYEVVEEEDN